MEYDVRSGNYTFKHIADTEPQTNQERFREHYHTTYELLYFLQGDADFSIQYTVYKLKPHCLLVIKPGEMHNVMIKSTARYERIVLRFGIESISPLLRQRLDALDKVYAIKGTHLSEELFRMDRLYQEISEDMRLTAFLGALDIILSYLCNGSNKSILADFVNEEIAPIVA